MKKRKSRDIALIVIVIACICLFTLNSMGIFSAQPEEEKTSSLVSSEDTTGTEPTDTDSIMEVPSVWKEEIDEKSHIDAVINFPDNIRKKGFQKATATIVDSKIEDILSLLEDDYHPYKTSEDDRIIQYGGTDELLFNFSKVREGIYVTNVFYDYVRMAYRDSLGSEDYNRDKYSTEEELDNFTLKEYEERMQEICKKLGIEGDTYIVHRALDYRIMEEEAVELHMDGTESIPDYNWTPLDNCYHATIFQLCNGIQVIPTYGLQSRGDILNFGANTCVINKERMVGMNISVLYKISYEEENEKLMQFSDILNIYKKGIGLMSQEYSTDITSIDMRVVPIEQGNGIYHMIPVWIFYGTRSYEENGKISSYTSAICIISALTGEIL